MTPSRAAHSEERAEGTNVERIARLIARRLGHNDETGMEWRRYVCAAELIDEEFQPRLLVRKAAS